MIVWLEYVLMFFAFVLFCGCIWELMTVDDGKEK